MPQHPGQKRGDTSLTERYQALYLKPDDNRPAPSIFPDGAQSTRSENQDGSAQSILAAAHALRTPFNAINGFAVMLRDAEKFGLDEARRAEYADCILAACDGLERLIGTMIDTAARDLGQFSAEPENMDLAAITASACEKAALRLARAGGRTEGRCGVRVTNKTRAPKIIGYADKSITSLVLDTLIDACIERSQNSCEVVMRASYDEHHCAEFSIRDFGEHICDEDVTAALALVADRGAGVGRLLRGKGASAAAAIALAKTLMEYQNGELTFLSRAGKGLLVHLVLPPAQSATLL